MDTEAKDAAAEAGALLEEYLGLFGDLIAEAISFAKTSGSSATEDELVRRIKQWQDATKSLIDRFVQQLCEIRPNYEWVRLEAEKAWPLINQKYLFVIAVILQLARAWTSDRETERELAERRQRIRSSNEALIRRAQYLALRQAQRRLASVEDDSGGEPRNDRLDIFQRTMKRKPHLSYLEICGAVDFQCQDKGWLIPIQPKCVRHHHKTLVESIICSDCRAYMESFLSEKRAHLDLPRPPKSKFPAKPAAAQVGQS